MEQNGSKICRMCCKEIPAKAKRCPYCHHWQSKFSMIVWSPFLPVAMIFILYILFGYLFKNMLDTGEDFTPYRDQITITESNLKFGEKPVCETVAETVAVVGTMSNKSPIPWKEVQIQVRFYDGNNHLVDAKQDNDYRFQVPANDTAAFKVTAVREFPKEQYAGYDVAVISARDARTRW